MTKEIRRTVCFIAVVLAIAAVFTFFAVATSGFTVLNGAEWFDYWGKGKPVTTVDNEPTEQSATRSAFNSSGSSALNYDSDEAEYNATVAQFSQPEIEVGGSYMGGSFGFSLNISTYGKYGSDWGDTLKVEFSGSDSFSYPLSTYTFEYSDKTFASNHKSDEISVDTSKLGSAFSNNTVIYVRATNLASGNILSNSVVYALHRNNNHKFFKADGTVIQAPAYTQYAIPMAPSGYYYKIRWGVLAYNSVDRSTATQFVGNFGIGSDMQSLSGMSPGSEIDKSSYLYKSLHIPASASFNYYGFGFDSDVETHELTITPDMYYTLDLTELSFINNLGAEFSVEFIPLSDISASVDGTLLMQNVPKYHFSVNKLATPTNVRLEGGCVKWNAVSGAAGYAVFVDDEKQGVVTEPVFSLEDNQKFLGEHVFRIRALGNIGKAYSEEISAKLTARNASINITQIVALTYDVGGDTVTKFVPIGKTVSEYLYEVDLPDKEFGGWYYDTGYSVAVNAEDKLNKDMTIYARLSDKPVTDRPLTWWDQYMWYVLGPAIGLVVLGIIAAIAAAVKKSRS